MQDAKNLRRDRDAQRLHDLALPDVRQFQLASVAVGGAEALCGSRRPCRQHAVGGLIGRSPRTTTT